MARCLPAGYFKCLNFLIERNMPIEILAYEETPLGILCLRRRNLVSDPDVSVTEVTLNHEFLMSSYLTESERELSTRGLQRVRQTSELSVLVGGFGLGYTANEVLKSDAVARVEVIEFLPQVIGWFNDDLIPLSSKLKSDDRLVVTEDDVYRRLTDSPNSTFDLIVIDVDHSPQDVLGPQSRDFYGPAGMARVGEHLKPDGVLGIWSYAEDTPLLANMREVFSDVEVEQVTVWNDLINVEQTDWLFFGRRMG